MHATVITYALPPEQIENVVAGIKENSRFLPEAPGFRNGYWLYDRERTTVYAIVLFETAEQAQAAWEEASPRVSEAFRSLGIVPDPRACEVVHQV